MALQTSQHQTTRQSQTANAVLQNSLTLLQFGPDDVMEAASLEARRNPFLTYAPKRDAAQPACPPAAQGGSATDTSHDPAATESTPAMLLKQIRLISFSDDEMSLACDLVHCLDDRGFLSDPADEMCSYLQTTPRKLIAVVATLQTHIEPAGVFAWSLKDCFRIQLSGMNRADPLILALIARLDLVARKDIPGICAHCGVSEEDAQDMLEDIRRLNPAPLAAQPDPGALPHEPELIFVEEGDGAIAVSLNSAALPKLLTDDGLFDQVKAVEIDEAALAYYRDCYRGAAAFVTAMQKRANTLLTIGQKIAEGQSKFILTGRPLDRKPLTMGALARTLSLNKSTISRALNKCLFQTPRGSVPASEFLVRPINDGSAARTRDQALRRLSVLIRAEDKSAPYSDEALVELMAKSNFVLSRRTVAKYRGLLGLPGRHHRRASRRP